jgi:hypothetical protein
MGALLNDVLVMEPPTNVTALAEIVKDLIMGTPQQQQDKALLRTHPLAACLTEHEYAALEALRVQIYERGMTLLRLVDQAGWI